MKNKDRIKQLEIHVEMLLNRVHILEMKANPLVPASAPPEWAGFKPFWVETQNPISTQVTCKIKPITFQGNCRYHH